MRTEKVRVRPALQLSFEQLQIERASLIPHANPIMKTAMQRSSRSGFTLMEIIVAVSILSIMAAGLAMRTSSLIDKGRTAKVINLVDTLKSACATYNLDTGLYPNEYSGYTAPNRKLSGTQTISGWQGPYIDGPLTHKQNPFVGSMHLYNRVTSGSWIAGFDVDADGTLDVTGSGCMLYLSNVPADAAETIDNSIDAGLPGTWSDAGRVVYQAGSKRLLILVFN